MEKLKEISRKYILDNDDERLMDALDRLGKVFKNEPVDGMREHLIEITKIENEHFIEFDNTEKVKIKESNILPYLEYILQIYKGASKNPKFIIGPLIKIEPNHNYMQIVVDDAQIIVKNEMVESLFDSLKNSGLIDNYSVYSSDEKYQKIKKCDYCLSPDEVAFHFYRDFEILEIEKTNNPQKRLK